MQWGDNDVHVKSHQGPQRVLVEVQKVQYKFSEERMTQEMKHLE